MDEFSQGSGSDHQTVGQDAGVLVGLLEKVSQERELLGLDDVQPVEGQVLTPTWGRWPW